jgi:camphor 5-monooxygenase
MLSALGVDFDRTTSEHTTVGNGPHRCPGALLALTEVRISLEEWLARILQFDVAPGEKIVYHGGIVGRILNLPLVWRV